MVFYLLIFLTFSNYTGLVHLVVPAPYEILMNPTTYGYNYIDNYIDNPFDNYIDNPFDNCINIHISHIHMDNLFDNRINIQISHIHIVQNFQFPITLLFPTSLLYPTILTYYQTMILNV